MGLEEVKVGVCAAGEDLQGWLRILRQEGLPHEVTSEPDWPLMVLGGTLPAWLEDYAARGGLAVVSGVPDAPGLLPPSTLATIHRFVPPDHETPCYAPGQVRLFRGQGDGQCALHEGRKVRAGNALDRFPAVLTQQVGVGHIVYTGIPLTQLLASGGDCLRRFSPLTELTERVASVDKAEVADTLVWMLERAFALAGIPYVRPVRYPHSARSVFIFRVDVDGAFRDHARRLAEVAASHGVRASFFINGERCEEEPGDLDVRAWPGEHEIGQHSYVHDVFEGIEANLENMRRGAEWLERTVGVTAKSFVAPRGLWNAALDEAISQMGYAYSSDFALDFDSLPFRTPSGVLQIPVHPYSPERDFVYAEEQGLAPPTSEVISNHYIAVLKRQVRYGRPVHVYGHPERLGGMAAEALPPLFKLARAEGLPTMTLTEFCEWWARRERVGMGLHLDRAAGELHASFGEDMDAEDTGGMPVEVVNTEQRQAARVGKQRVSVPLGSAAAVVHSGFGSRSARSDA